MEEAINSNFLKLQAPNSFDTKKFEIGAVSALMGKETGGRFTPTAIRLRAVRRASPCPEPKKAFADFLGITFSRLSNIENGHPLSRDVQDRVIAKMPWVSRSWLVDGDEASLTGAALHRLAPLVAEESDTTLPRSRSKGSSARSGPKRKSSASS